MCNRECETRPESIAPSHNFDCLVDNLHLLIQNRMKRRELMAIRIAGYASLGKTTLTRALASSFEDAASIGIDSFMFDRETRRAQCLNGSDPKSIDFLALQIAIEQLTSGKSIDIPMYNHQTGKHDTVETIRPSKILFLEGTPVLYPQLKLCVESLNIFLDADYATRVQLFHDESVAKRGYSEDQFQKILPGQIFSNEVFIKPSKTKADYVCVVNANLTYQSAAITHCACGM